MNLDAVEARLESNRYNDDRADARALLAALRTAINLMRVDHWSPDNDRACSCGRYICEARTFWMEQAGVESTNKEVK